MVEFRSAQRGVWATSPVKSPTATENGFVPTATSGAAVKPPAPSPRRTETVLFSRPRPSYPASGQAARSRHICVLFGHMYGMDH